MLNWYPEQFQELIASHGFDVVSSHGGYSGESYGQGPELIIVFKKKWL